MTRSHTVGEAFAYFCFRTLNCCIGARCFACDMEWFALQSDEQQVGGSK